MRLTKWTIGLGLLLLAAATTGLFAYLRAASEEQLAYVTLPPAQAAPPAAKIEVVEFFWYGCPHCNKYEPVLAAWADKHAAQVTLRRVAVGLHQKQVPQQQMFYALEALGKLDELHRAVFEQIHQGKQALNTSDSIAGFMQQHGINREQWLAAYDSADVKQRMEKALQLQRDYKVERVPSVVLAGRYLTSPSMVGMKLPYLGQTDEIRYAETGKLLDELLLQLKSERGTL